MMPTLPPTARQRLLGVDLARCVALFGMFAVHAAPFGYLAIGTGSLSTTAFNGRASALFCVLAGLSLALVARRWPQGEGAGRRLDRWILARAAVIAGIGLLLTELHSDVTPVLTIYGILFALSVPARRLSARQLAIGAAVLAVLAPVLSLVVRRRLGILDDPLAGSLPTLSQLVHPFGGWVEFARTASLTGFYPIVTWLPYLLAGMAIGRADLSSVRTSARLAVGGAILAVSGVLASALAIHQLDAVVSFMRATHLAFGRGTHAEAVAYVHDMVAGGGYGSSTVTAGPQLLLTAGHSGAPLEIISSIGSAMLVIGLATLVAAHLPRLALAPFVAAGSMTLTIYTAHVLVLRAFGTYDGFSEWSSPSSLGAYLGLVAGSITFALLWRTRFRKGPLEHVAARLGRLAADGRGPRSQKPARRGAEDRVRAASATPREAST